MDEVKARVEIMLESANKLVRSWESLIENGGGSADIEVKEYVRGYTSSVISSAIFGSNNSKGIELFPKFRAVMKVMHSSTLLEGLSIHRYLPTKDNRYAWGLDKEITSFILDMTKEHSEAVSKEQPQVIMESTKTGELGPLTPEQYIVDNCRNVYLPGFEVTAVASMWGLMLLASHPEWQDRIRAEVAQACAGRPLEANMPGKMKVLKMVIQEVLRLYSGVAILTRHTLKDVQLGDVSVPEGVGIWVWLPALHQDSEFWGPDGAKFNPERGLLIVFLGPATLPVPTSRLVLETELVLARA
ncbi:cytochrome P450 714C2-like [Vitis riparia]|uniref:cytochrome P450 714C2-like n=1 Tax=Vitis riparia TaxID=96939 RepID=UPI00155A0852|nr:cytochrome P450 714C2-like [Vitis riparia]